MSLLELILIAVGLSMDAFAVAVCAGLGLSRVTLKNALIVGAYFGAFQAAMPFAGYMLASSFAGFINAFDHWIAFVLLCFIGGKMIASSLKKENRSDGCCQTTGFSLRPGSMLPLAFATSVDALAVGVSFAFLDVDILRAVCYIGVITMLLCVAGVKIGSVFGMKFRWKAELAGGVILVLIGTNILLEGLGVIVLFG